MDEDQDEAGEDAIEDLQAGHSSAVAIQHYARTVEQSSFLGDYFFLQYANCSKKYHSLFGLGTMSCMRKDLDEDEKRWKVNALKVMGKSNTASSLASENSATLLTPGYSQENWKQLIREETAAAIKEVVESLGTSLRPSISTGVGSNLRNVMTDAESGVESALEVSSSPAPISSLPTSPCFEGQESSPIFTPTHEPLDMASLPLSHDLVLQRCLESLLNGTVHDGPITFKSRFQKEAARAIADLEKGNLVLVGPTASGKTYTWMIWAAHQVSQTNQRKMVVICPLIALKEEFYSKASGLNIPAFFWTSSTSQPPQNTILIFMSVEDLLDRNFECWVAMNHHQIVSKMD